MDETVHPSITINRVCDAVERRMTSLDNPGFCTSCGEEADARRGKCEYCGDRAVYGADELLIRMVP
jgi:hypothetical protein